MNNLYNIDIFLSSVVSAGYKGMNKMKASGFKEYMRKKDMLFVEDDLIFKKELDYYLSH